jgi:hypothetical protein
MKSKKKLRKYQGLPVYDAPLNSKLEFQILPEDIKGSRKNDPSKCAAAKSIEREFKTDVRVHISRTYVKSKDKKSWIRYITPEAVSREIVSFDRGSSFEPGIYKVNAASKESRLGTYHTSSSTKGSYETKRKRPTHFTAKIRERALKH